MPKTPPSPPQYRMVNRDRNRRLDILRKGSSHSLWRDPYHLLLTLHWPWFFGLIGVGYIAANALFALLYLAGGDCIQNARPGYFWDTFFFSVQTMASIGYGAMYPRPECTYTNILVTIEALTGLMGLTIATGLMFARFSRPTARVLFSRVAVIAPHDGVPTLMFRTANERRNQILEAQLQVSLLRNEVTLEGEFMRRFYDLKLVRSQTPIFALTWTAMHQIDESSPLYGATPNSLSEEEAEIIVTLTGLDETVSQTIHARHSYVTEEILWHRRFVDLFVRKRDGRRIIDYTRFHDVKSV
ncbi:MAG TPA: ATP-sensitive inward rectifier potassium channel 10 [Cyanobacteria bacterium UBA8803]|nr:ATP-sensitive inward rectifier potassium channel 10 [Cyanobacteria bacterium UBA9273]HBL62167.1 ATP-sensitive inward rectifier potassium channel 10 [Cyanobacteria bacterium UBA8803]